MNKELCGLVRCFRIYLREKAKMEVTTESPLLPWLVRHCGWILSRYAIWLEKSDRSDEHIIGSENGDVLARSFDGKSKASAGMKER